MKFQNPNSRSQIIKAPLKILSSKIFLLWVIGCWILFYVLSAIWIKEAFANFVFGLKENLFIQIPFVLFLLSGCLNLIRVSRDIFRRNKLLFFAWVFLPAGIMFFFTGFFISASSRQSEWIVVGQDHTFKPGWSHEKYTVTKVDSGLKETFFDFYLETDRGIFQYEPTLTITDSLSNTVDIGGFPPVKIKDTFFHILKFGLAPGIRFSEDGRILDKGYMPLRILTPGSSDYFQIPGYPYRFLLSLAPVKTFQEGSHKASQFNIKKPFYKVRIFKGDKIIAEADSVKEMNFDNFTLEFFEPTFWIQLEVVRDPGYPVILAGLLFIGIGIPLSLVLFILKHLKRDRRDTEVISN